MKWRFWEKAWAQIKCAACGHTGRQHRFKKIYVEPSSSVDTNYKFDMSCKKCDCKTYYREDCFVLVTCKKCGVKYYATSAGNPDGVAFCPNGDLDYPFEPYCPGPGGTRYTPEEWDSLYGDKKE